MINHGFVRVACAVPEMSVANVSFNVEHIATLMGQAQAQQVDVLLCPEMSLTGYTCGDLFHQSALQQAALDGLFLLAQKTATDFAGLLVVGLPIEVDDRLFNTAAILQGGRVLGIVPKCYLPNYKEFYDARWYAPGLQARSQTLLLGGQEVPFGHDLLFDASRSMPGLIVGVEICEDLWVPIPPSCLQALGGATLLLNPSASNEVIGKAPYRRQLIVNQSARCLAAYVYTSSGVHESSTDIVFSGHGVIAENGSLLAESSRFERQGVLISADVDIQKLRSERQQMNSFGENQAHFAGPAVHAGPAHAGMPWRRIPWTLQSRRTPSEPLRRMIEAHPFVPRGEQQLRERCEEIFHIQVAGLAKRLEHVGNAPLCIGVSGGLDSTLALLVACKTLDRLGRPRSQIQGFTMPGFGTTSRTLENARALMQHLEVSPKEIDIRGLCLDEMRALEHQPFGISLAGLTIEKFAAKLQKVPAERLHDLTFENVQARMRTSLLMNAGFVIGTGDLSELALGWCTYNADHMSMYNPNVSIPKTLVRFLVRWAAENEFAGKAQKTLLDIVATLISPELLPAGADGDIVQSTEDAIGPYELHDFFLFHFLRYGARPDKILYLAQNARFDGDYAPSTIRRWLGVFVERFFANQFKRSCLPDGPKVGTISLSPRGDWRMPSDAQAASWLAWLRDRE